MYPRLRTLLWNDDAHRLRLPWRLLALVVAITLLGLLASLAVGALFSDRVRSVLALTSTQSTAQALVAARNVAFLGTQLLVTIGGVYLAGRFVDRRWFRDFGFRFDQSWWADLGFGLALGAGLMTGIFVVELLAGWVTVTELFYVARTGFSFWPWFLWGLATFVAVGVYEELLFRGYLLTNLSEGFTWFERLGTRGAVATAVFATSILFGAAHAGNPNATLASTAGIVLAALMLAAGYVLTGELAIPIGLHTTWNFFQGVVFGFPVSGTANGVSVVAISQSGPRVVTGGAFGPEAGLLGLAAAAVGAASTVWWVRWRTGTVGVSQAVVVPHLRRSGGE
ncbi:CPBP family intramembrane metalloprotease [Halobellus sp. Atlit-31R]|nr:CPBP family intramembrane metalloprotease [Halobellus sp. Atlit-31R]